jgi:hypothetical protein
MGFTRDSCPQSIGKVKAAAQLAPSLGPTVHPNSPAQNIPAVWRFSDQKLGSGRAQLLDL